MSTSAHHQGQRLSLKGQSCTVRYVGPVGDKSGEWLGVEWDDAERGKHDGTFAGVKYFECRSHASTAASFLRPSQSWDRPRPFLQALTEKYMSTDTNDTGSGTVYFSGKQAEEVGFSKFSERQAKLQGIHVLVLDRMRIKHDTPLSDVDVRTISELCADIRVLDLTGNLFETFSEITALCALLPKLQSLTLDANHFDLDEGHSETLLPAVRALSLSRTLFTETELEHVLSAFSSLETLDYADNELSSWLCPRLLSTLTSLDLSRNPLNSLVDIQLLGQHCPSLRTLSLQNNQISTVGSTATLPANLQELSLAHNAIDDWGCINDLRHLASLRSLRVTGNPLYTHLVSAEGKPLAAEDGYMLTIARLPQVETLNYSKVSEKERLNAETYYLSQIAVELSQTAEGDEDAVVSKHPRYRELCEEYGEPNIQRRARSEEIDPRSLAARLAKVKFHLAQGVLEEAAERSWQEEIPKSFDVYAVLGLVGKRLGVAPLTVGLVLETGEQDPTLRDSGYGGPEVWDSSDEEDGAGDVKDSDWTTRETELSPGTRALGTYVEGIEATIKVVLASDGS